MKLSHGMKKLLIDSIVDDADGNAGEGLLSKVAVKDVHVKVLGDRHSVVIKDRLTARDGDEVDINVAG